MRVYFDNGATSYPKPEEVSNEMVNYIKNIGSNIGRGIYKEAIYTEDIVYETREILGELFNFNLPENVCFTKNITESLNVIIKGLIEEGDEVIVSSVEHNAVMRPLNGDKAKIIKLPFRKNGEIDLNILNEELSKNPKAVIMTHSSNVSGDILKIKEVGEVCKKNGIPFIVDGAQSAGILDIDMEKMNIDCFCFTGHKSLLGPQGVGGFLIKDDLAKRINPFVEGGTGSKSDFEFQPEYMPDKFESGTMNIPGIFGLNASLKYIKEKGISDIYSYEINLLRYFSDELSNLNRENKFKLIGINDIENKTPIISLDFKDMDNAYISQELQSKYGILNRCGLHCSPSAHKFYGTFPQGTVRFGIGHYNSKKEVDYVVESLYKILNY